MVDKQTRKSTPPHIFIAALVLIFGTILSIGLSLVSFSGDSVSAINGCPDQERPGTGIDEGKCVGLDGKPTNNIPEGQQGPSADTNDPVDETTTDDETTCAIEKIGWILCPIIEGAGKIGDQAFGFLAKTFLETEPELIGSNAGQGTQRAWDMARNLANIMFIIAFLVIIYSQVTGAGITNYGIKKMLPRLVVAAIAVNVSYYICQIMVDLTNIMGYEIQNFLVQVSRELTQNSAMPVTSGQSFGSGGTLTTIAISVLAIGVVAYFLLPVLGAVIGLVLMTCLSIIVILLLRKAFIVLLIVASPIAFVLYLLPNTEKYFQKWLSMFWKLLLVFPTIGLLMGGGQLASAIILVAGVTGAQSNTNTQSAYSDEGTKCVNLPSQPNTDPGQEQPATQATTGECTGSSVPFMLGLTAAGVAVLPLLAVYSVLQGALSAAGAIGGKIGGAVGNWNNGRKGALSKRRQELGEYRQNKRDVAAMTGSGLMGRANVLGRRGARRRGKYGAAKEEAGAAQEAYNRAARLGNKGSMEDAQEMLTNRRRAYDEKINADNISAQHLDVDTLTTETAPGVAGHAGGQAGQAAADLIAKGEFDSPRLAALLENLSESNHAVFMQLASQLHGQNLATKTASSAMGKAGIYGGGDVARMLQGNPADAAGNRESLASAAVKNAASGGLTAAKIVGASNNAMGALNGAIHAHSDAQEAATAANNAQNSLNNMSDQLKDSLSQSKVNSVNNMRGNGP